MIAGVLILAFWAYLIWIWRVHHTARVESVTGERRTVRTPNRWN